MTQVRDYATRPLVTCESEMDIEEAAALMVQHRVRRLPVMNGEQLVGIVTLDDLAVRSGDLAARAADDRRGGQGRAAAVLLPPAGRLMSAAHPGSSGARAPAWRR